MSNFEAIKEWRVLDYGGGDGQLAQLLCAGVWMLLAGIRSTLITISRR
jgi:hypothetical protein